LLFVFRFLVIYWFSIWFIGYIFTLLQDKLYFSILFYIYMYIHIFLFELLMKAASTLVQLHTIFNWLINTGRGRVWCSLTIWSIRILMPVGKNSVVRVTEWECMFWCALLHFSTAIIIPLLTRTRGKWQVWPTGTLSQLLSSIEILFLIRNLFGLIGRKDSFHLSTGTTVFTYVHFHHFAEWSLISTLKWIYVSKLSSPEWVSLRLTIFLQCTLWKE
jgi:hypothetical protein